MIKMPFRKNVQREDILLSHWRQGHTVKTASVLTRIPEGSISHYYARFNRNKDKYLKLTEHGYQEPPRSSPFKVAITSLAKANILKNVAQCAKKGDYAQARDILQVCLLLMDFEKRLNPIIQNIDPEKMGEVQKNMMMIVDIIGST